MPQISLLYRFAGLIKGIILFVVKVTDPYIFCRNAGRKDKALYQALYRTYRPEVFEEVLGQEHIVRILQNQLKTDTVGHAYLFCGTRGTGKTTMARLLAKGLNCLSDGERPCGHCENCLAIKNGTFMDVIEIDAASNNSVDNIRELRESVKYPPAIGRKKVYIIDEVHMLSSGAFNALLKTLEEPPENVIFILATTEPHKVLQTVMSRCLRLDFKRVPERTIASGMSKICSELGIDVSEDAIRILAANADGSVRDGLSILDQCLSTGIKKVTRNDVLEFLGATGEEVFIELTDAVLLHKMDAALLLIDKVLADGKDELHFAQDWLAHYRSLLITKYVKNPEDILNRSSENSDRIRTQSDRLDLSEINAGIMEISKTIADIKRSSQARVLLELCAIKLATAQVIGSATAQIPGRGQTQKQSPLPASHAEQPAAQSPQPASHAEQPAASPASVPQGAPGRAAAQEEALDLEKLWHAILEEGESIQGSINTIDDARLIKLGDTTFSLQISPAKKLRAERMRQLLERLMQEHTGRYLRMELVTEPVQGSVPEEKKSTEAYARELGGILGLAIEVEK